MSWSGCGTMSGRLRAIATCFAVAIAAGPTGIDPVAADTIRYAATWGGGTIDAGTTVVIEDGASITGNVTANGSLRFDRISPLTVTSMISGTGELAVANTGTVALAGLTSGTGQFNLAINVSAGQLSIGSTGTNPVVLGNAGTAALEVTGGQVRSGVAFLGVGPDGVATATISGGSWSTNNRLLHVGHSGTGALVVAGGRMSNSSGVIGSTNTGVGSAVVSSGTWSNWGGLFVGGYQGSTGRGTLTLTGGQISNVACNIGISYGSVGSATVSGGVWNSSSALTVASLGAGALDITGGLVSSASGAIGSGTSGVGAAAITGGTWSMAGSLVVGGEGVGTLAISGSGGSGGTVIVGGTLSRGSAGTISLGAGGTLQIGTGTTAARLATDLVNNGSVVFRPSGTSVLSHAVSGSGTVRVAGPGRLAVTGTSSYSGPTEVAGGALLVSGALGSTAITVNAGGLLGGSGAVSGPVTVNAGGTLAPGASIESLAIGSLSLFDGSAFDVEIDSSAPAAVAADFLRVTGDLTLMGTTVLAVTDLALTPSSFGPGTILSLINYSGAWNGGRFSYGGTTLADGASFGIGSQLWTIDYDAVGGGVNFAADYLPGGRFVNLTAVPEPATVGLLLAGLGSAAGLSTRRRGRRLPKCNWTTYPHSLSGVRRCSRQTARSSASASPGSWPERRPVRDCCKPIRRSYSRRRC